VLFVLPAVSRVYAGAGSKVARAHVEFAKQLAREQIEMTDDLATWFDTAVDSSCSPVPSAATSASESRRRILNSFAEKVCKPWSEFWESAMAPCDAEPPAAWCDDEVAGPEHIDLAGYFKTLTVGIRNAASTIERDALIRIVVNTFEAHVMTEFPASSLDRWAADTLSAYSNGASPAAFAKVARQLKETWVHEAPQVADVITKYANAGTTLDTNQKNELLVIAQYFASRQSQGTQE